MYDAVLALADGSVFHGRSIGVSGVTVGEVVFNTAMTGYQEILTDPSYQRQIVTLTYPHIGNTGTNAEDYESASTHAAGLVIRDLPLAASNFRSSASLTDFLQRHQVVAIADIDTRRLTRVLRDQGALGGAIVVPAATTKPRTGDAEVAAQALAAAQGFAGLSGVDLAREVSCSAPYEWHEPLWRLAAQQPGRLYPAAAAADAITATGSAPDAVAPQAAFSPATPAHRRQFHVVAMDFGVKHNILRMLVERGCRVTVVPAQTSAADILAYQPDGVFLSNGPGDPEPCDYAIRAISSVLEQRVPVFGICLGHQLLALASGARTQKMKFGHHGANHPVRELSTGQVMISSQNHGFAVDPSSLGSRLRATHESLFDGSLQGIERLDTPAFGFQGHPEASPGPHDVAALFDRFISMMAQPADARTAPPVTAE